MNYNINKRLKQIKTENNIWIIYLFIIGFSFYANKLEKDYFINNNIKSKELYRKINASIFTILIVIYSYFEKDSLESFFNKNKSNSQKKFDTLSLIATTAVLLSGIIFLYIIITDNNLEEEIAFN